MKHIYTQKSGRIVSYTTRIVLNHTAINSTKAHQIAAGGIL
jgi:hypothetical protein